MRSTTQSEINISTVEAMIQEDCNVHIQHIARELDISIGTVHAMISNSSIENKTKTNRSRNELKTAVCQWFFSQQNEFYTNGIQKLVSRWEKCFNIQGNYI